MKITQPRFTQSDLMIFLHAPRLCQFDGHIEMFAACTKQVQHLGYWKSMWGIMVPNRSTFVSWDRVRLILHPKESIITPQSHRFSAGSMCNASTMISVCQQWKQWNAGSECYPYNERDYNQKPIKSINSGFMRLWYWLLMILQPTL